MYAISAKASDVRGVVTRLNERRHQCDEAHNEALMRAAENDGSDPVEEQQGYAGPSVDWDDYLKEVSTCLQPAHAKMCLALQTLNDVLHLRVLDQVTRTAMTRPLFSLIRSRQRIQLPHRSSMMVPTSLSCRASPKEEAGQLSEQRPMILHQVITCLSIVPSQQDPLEARECHKKCILPQHSPGHFWYHLTDFNIVHLH